MKSKIAIALIILLSLGACAGTAEKLNAIEKGYIQPKVDKTIAVLISKLCDLPLNTQLRAIKNNVITVTALVEVCGSWRAVRDAMIGSTFQRLGINVPTIAPLTLPIAPVKEPDKQ